MKQHIRSIGLVWVVGLLFGFIAAGADYMYGQHWYIEGSLATSLLGLTASVVGGAGGFWALTSLGVSFAATRKLQKLAPAMLANIGFLLLAVAAYYVTAPLLDGHLSPYPAKTVLLWGGVAIIVGLLNGLASYWLASKVWWQWVPAVSLVIGYVVADCIGLLRLAEATGLVGRGALVGLVYLALVGLFIWKARS